MTSATGAGEEQQGLNPGEVSYTVRRAFPGAYAPSYSESPEDEDDEIFTNGNMSDDISEYGLTVAPIKGKSGKSKIH